MDSPAPYWDGVFFELVNVLATMNILDSRHMVLDRFFFYSEPRHALLPGKLASQTINVEPKHIFG